MVKLIQYHSQAPGMRAARLFGLEENGKNYNENEDITVSMDLDSHEARPTNGGRDKIVIFAIFVQNLRQITGVPSILFIPFYPHTYLFL